MFFPTPGAITFSETLLGLLPVTAPVQWLFGNPVLAYNVAVLVSFPLCALAAHALGLQLTGRHDAAFLAGLAFGLSPYRAHEFGHVQMISYYWAPVLLLALHRYRKDRRWTWLALFAAAWLMQTLSNGYALFHLAVLIVLWLVWFSRTLREAATVAVAWVCASLPLIPVLMKYREIHADLHLARSIGDIRRFSADITGLFSAPPQAVLWGDRLSFVDSNAVFPGVTVCLVLIATMVVWRRHQTPMPASHSRDRVALALVALICVAVAGSAALAGPWTVGPLRVTEVHKPLTLAFWAALMYFARGPRWRRVWRERSTLGFYALATGTFYLLALGPEPRFLGSQALYKPPYAWLLELPGFDSIRTPVRFAMLGVLCLAVVVALSYARWTSRDRKRDRFIWFALSLGLIADGWIRMPSQSVPPSGPSEQWPSVAAVLELPLRPDTETPALFRSMGYGSPIINGASGYSPPHYPALTYTLGSGDVSVIRDFSRYGPIGVVLDRTAAEATSLEDALARLEGVTLLGRSSSWTRYVVSASIDSRTRIGRRLQIRSARANQNPDQIARLLDDRIETHWSSGEQLGSEELVFELDGEEVAGSIVLQIGSCPFGFPRDLTIEASRDGLAWTEVWRGQTALATVRAALDDPSKVPISIQIASVPAKLIRLKQVGREPSVPWCVAEASIHQPAR